MFPFQVVRCFEQDSDPQTPCPDITEQAQAYRCAELTPALDREVGDMESSWIPTRTEGRTGLAEIYEFKLCFAAE